MLKVDETPYIGISILSIYGLVLVQVFTYLLTFGVVLTAGVITKALVLLMTSQLKSAKKLPICSKSDHQFSK